AASVTLIILHMLRKSKVASFQLLLNLNRAFSSINALEKYWICVQREQETTNVVVYRDTIKAIKFLGTFLNIIKRILDVLHCRTPMASRRLTFAEEMPHIKAVAVFKEMIICPPIEAILKPFEAKLKLAR
nr:hypothetical protein [Tanacetum cinerariifolium]